MLAVFPCYAADVYELRRLMRWIGQLGGCPKHHALIVADAGTPWPAVERVVGEAKPHFDAVATTRNQQNTVGWPYGPNSLFKAAVEWVQANGKPPFFWLETDAIPLMSGWLDVIAAEYATCGKRYMGSIYKSSNQHKPGTFLSGVSVYPGDCGKEILPYCDSPNGFDVDSAMKTLPHAVNTPVLQHVWGTQGLPPTFVEDASQKTVPNAVVLDSIRPKAVVFHRNKDGTLMQLLRKRAGFSEKFVVVLGFCNSDYEPAMRLLEWVGEMKTEPTHTLLLPTDTTVGEDRVKSAAQSGRMAFQRVMSCKYLPPEGGEWAPNVAWRNSALTMQKLGLPWLWIEPDCVPLKPNWLKRLQATYDLNGKPFMGPIVPERGHMNGTGIYPANTPLICLKAMAERSGAWDVTMRPEMIHLCHDCGDIFQHAWGVVGGKLHPWMGPAPSFTTQTGVTNNIGKKAVIFHRCKNGSLIERLRERTAEL